MGISLVKLKEKLSKDRFSIGLDIGTYALKLVKLKLLKDGSAELCSFAVELNSLELNQSLKKIKQSEAFEIVNLSVSGPSTLIRYINFPKMGQGELKQALKFEAQKHIPFSISEINFDAHILKDDLPDNKMLVLLAASKKEVINQHLKAAQEAGLKVNIIDIDSLALVNAFTFNYPEPENAKQQSVSLLNIGASISSLNILERGVPRLSRDINIAGNNFTQKLADIFGIDLKSAEALKFKPDKENMQKMTAAFETVLTNLAGEIRTSFDYYESQSTSSVAKIFLSGGASSLSGLKEGLTKILGIEIECWDPFKNIKIPANLDLEKTKLSANHLGIAVGLALR